jgi:hypothetical protein
MLSANMAFQLLERFSGLDDKSFSGYILQFNDFCNAFEPIPNLANKINRLKYFMTDFAREKINELTEEHLASWENVEKRLSELLENPELSSVAKFRVLALKQNKNETVVVFSMRLIAAVKAANIGQPSTAYESRLLQEFLDKLHSKIAFFVKTKRPADFLEALHIARHYESLCQIEYLKDASILPTKNLSLKKKDDEKLSNNQPTSSSMAMSICRPYKRLDKFSFKNQYDQMQNNSELVCTAVPVGKIKSRTDRHQNRRRKCNRDRNNQDSKDPQEIASALAADDLPPNCTAPRKYCKIHGRCFHETSECRCYRPKMQVNLNRLRPSTHLMNRF